MYLALLLCFRRASRRVKDPRVLFCMKGFGSVMLLSTWVSAAMFMMASASFTILFTSFGLQMSPLMKM